MKDKREYRSCLLDRRRAILVQEYEKGSTQICERIIRTQTYKDCKHILMYSAVRGEVSLQRLFEDARERQKQIYFPKVEGLSMDFFRVREKANLVPGAFGVLEPSGEEERFERDNHKYPVLVLVPGVGFSTKGDRIGYGKGYYDRYLADLKKHSQIFAWGICFELQLIPPFVHESHDYPMDAIVTEDRYLEIHN